MTYQPSNIQPQAVAIEIVDVLRGMWNRKLLVVLLMLAGFVISLLFVMTAKPQYSSEAQVLVDRLDTPFDRTQPTDPGDRQAFDERDILSQVAVLDSQDLGERVITALNLTSRDEFDSLKNGLGFPKRLMIALGFGSDPRLQSPDQRAMDRYVDKLSVYQIPQSKVIAVRFTSSDPRTAAEVANTLAEVYVTATREAQSEPTGRARDWLSEEIEKLRKKVVESEGAVEEFRAKNGLLKGVTTTLGTQELSELNTQIILAEAARSEARAKANSIRDLLASRGTVDASAEVLNSSLIQRLREQEAQQGRIVAELSATYLPNHPKMIGANNEMAKLQRQIRAEVLKIVDGLEEQAKVASSRVASLKASLDSLKSRETTANIDEVELRALEREATANRQLLEALLNRYSDASARQEVAAQPGFARIIQRAGIPSSPSFPKSGPTVLLATMAGFALGLGLAFLLEVMAAASRINRPVAVAPPVVPQLPMPPAPAYAPPPVMHERPVPPVAQIVPQPPPAPEPPAEELLPSLCELPTSPDVEVAITNGFEVVSGTEGVFSAAIKRIGSWAISLRQTLGVKRLAISATGAGRHDTKACIAGLARALSAQGAKVIVVDSAQNPQGLEAMFGVQTAQGLAEVLTGQSPFAAVIVKDEASNVHVLQAGLNWAGALGHMSSQRMDLVLSALDSAYDFVLIHAGDYSGLSSTMVKRCHAALVVTPGGQFVDAARILHELRQAGLRAVQYVRLSDGRGASASGYPEAVSA